MPITGAVNTLWSMHALPYKNVEIRTSYYPAPVPQASLKMFPSPSNAEKSKESYVAPEPVINLPPQFHPQYLEQNSLNPLTQQEKNNAVSKMASPHPYSQDITGKDVPYDKKLNDMNIYNPAFNWYGVSAIGLIVLAVIVVASRFK